MENICVLCSEKYDLVSTDRGRERILVAATQRGDTEVLSKINNSHNNIFFYHMNNPCYRSYTQRADIERAQRNGNNRNQSTQSLTLDTESCSSKKNCVICDNDSQKRSNKKCKLTQESCAYRLFNAARIFMDDVYQRISGLETIEDICQSNIYYHNNCLRRYLKRYEKYLSENENRNSDEQSDSSAFISSVNDNVTNSDDFNSSTVNDNDRVETSCSNNKMDKQTAICLTIESIKYDLILGKVYSITEIREQVQSLNSCSDVQNRDIINVIKRQYSAEITCIEPKRGNKPTLVISKSMNLYDILDVARSTSHLLKESAKRIRNLLRQYSFDLNGRFCDETDLKRAWNNMQIPADLVSFFSELFNFETEDYYNLSPNNNDENEEDDHENEYNIDHENTRSKFSSKVMRLRVECLFQMMFYILHHGKEKTALHTMVGLAVHSTCKSVSLVKSFNRLGLSVSYEEIERQRTRLANFVVENSMDNVPIPTHFNKNTFTVASFDNFDHNEATMSGLNSTHDTVAVLFQESSKEDLGKPKINETDVPTRDKILNCQELQEFAKPTDPLELPENFKMNSNGKNLTFEIYNKIRREDFAWQFCRLDLSESSDGIFIRNSNQNIPTWAPFNSVLINDKRPVHAVGFLPILPYPVTEYNTVYTALCNFQNVNSQLLQQSLPIFCDEGVYRIARNITLRHADKFKDIIVLLGNFHLIKTYLGAIGKYLDDSGVENLLIETEVFGSATVHQVLNGINYKRSIYGFFLLEESLRRLQLQAFFEDRDINDFNLDVDQYKILQESLDGEQEIGRGIFESLQKNSTKLITEFEEFITIRCNESPLFKYWNNVLIMIQLLKDLIRADRIRDWPLHVATVEKIQPLFHVMNCTNYARWCSLYVQDIQGLRNTHPDIFLEFCKGSFTIKLSNASFSSTAVDQALEKTINRSMKSASGIIGSTRKKEYVTRWELVYHEELAVTNLFKKLTFVEDNNDELKNHHDISTSVTKKSEESVIKIIDYIEKHKNPFSPGEHPLLNICTQQILSAERVTALLDILNTGYQLYQKFCDDRLSPNRKKSLNATIPRYSIIDKKDSKQSHKRDSSSCIKSLQNAQRIIDLARERNYSLEKLFTYELTPYSSLFTETGSIKFDTNKHSFIDSIMTHYKILSPRIPVSDCSILILNLLHLCKKIKWKGLKTFNDLARAFIKQMAAYITPTVVRIDFIQESFALSIPRFTQYNLSDSKETITLNNIDDNVPLPKLPQNFWPNIANMLRLQHYLSKYLLERSQGLWPNIEVILSSMEKRSGVSTCPTRLGRSPELINESLLQEEYERLIIHTFDAVKDNHKIITIINNHSDNVAILAHYWRLFEQHGLEQLWVEYELSSGTKVIPIHTVAASFEEKALLLPAIHNLTGSSFTSKIGTKNSALKMNTIEFLSTFTTDLQNSSKAVSVAEEYLVQVLKTGNPSKTFDQLRYWQYHYGSNFAVSELPPTSATLQQHILRAIYVTSKQTTILNDKNRTEINPINYGYVEEGGILVPKKIITILPPIEYLVPNCNCTKCKRSTCPCDSAGISCCGFCRCRINNSCLQNNKEL